MIKHVWSVLCSNSSVDRDSNTISLFSILEQLATETPMPTGEKTIPLQMVLVTLWTRENIEEPTSGRARIRWLAPDGSPIGEPSVFNIDLTSHYRMRYRFFMPSIKVHQPGRYYFSVEVGNDEEWEQVAQVPLEISFELREETVQ